MQVSMTSLPIMCTPQAAPTTLKAAFLDPVDESMSTEIALELFAKTDADYMHMFTGGLPTNTALSPTCLTSVVPVVRVDAVTIGSNFARPDNSATVCVPTQLLVP